MPESFNPSIHISSSLEELRSFIAKSNYSRIVFFVDENTHEFCLNRLLAQLPMEIKFEILEVSAGEESKSLEVLGSLYEALDSFDLDRNALIVNVGGGVVCDLGGFMASTFLRGIDFINIPTSLLAQVDASVGGKNGINLGKLKNRIGTFNNPRHVFVNLEFLETLDPRELRNGFAEMLKHALIHDAKHWDSLIEICSEKAFLTEDVVSRSIEIKNIYVQKDFQEQGIRKALNFGHTVGHAIESYYMSDEDPLLHGEAVAYGIIAEAYVSSKMSGLNKDELDHIKEVMQFIYGPCSRQLQADDLIRLAYADKKAESEQIVCSLISSIGQYSGIYVCTEELMKEAIEFIQL